MTQDKQIYWINELGMEFNDTVGKKCANLGELAKIGVQVPRGFAISTQAWEKFVRLNGIADEMRKIIKEEEKNLDIPSKGQKVSQSVRKLIEAQNMPEEIASLVICHYETLCRQTGISDISVAVRSAGSISMPGAMETYLNVSGNNDLIKKLIRVWSSAYTYRAILYRHNNNLSIEYAPIGVAVLEQINAKAAGVLMTANPTSGNKSELIIESNWGLGESVVSGVVNPDLYSVDKKTLSITSKAINKKEKKSGFNFRWGWIRGYSG